MTIGSQHWAGGGFGQSMDRFPGAQKTANLSKVEHCNLILIKDLILRAPIFCTCSNEVCLRTTVGFTLNMLIVGIWFYPEYTSACSLVKCCLVVSEV